MLVNSDSLSVLVVDDEPEILSFFARLLDVNGMRALLATNPAEAVGIARRGYVPIDLVLTDISLKPQGLAPDIESGPELVNQLRELRPEIRVLYMTAFLDAGVIRIELMNPGCQTTSNSPDDPGLIESIRAAACAPLVNKMSSAYRH